MTMSEVDVRSDEHIDRIVANPDPGAYTRSFIIRGPLRMPVTVYRR